MKSTNRIQMKNVVPTEMGATLCISYIPGRARDKGADRGLPGCRHLLNFLCNDHHPQFGQTNHSKVVYHLVYTFVSKLSCRWSMNSRAKQRYARPNRRPPVTLAGLPIAL
jgi:hypothetical protein